MHSLNFSREILTLLNQNKKENFWPCLSTRQSDHCFEERIALLLLLYYCPDFPILFWTSEYLINSLQYNSRGLRIRPIPCNSDDLELELQLNRLVLPNPEVVVCIFNHFIKLKTQYNSNIQQFFCSKGYIFIREFVIEAFRLLS